MPLDDAQMRLATELGRRLVVRGWRVSTAESCTGGLVAGAITAIAGSSDWFERGFVTYSNAAKNEMLGVPAELIDKHGAVSETVAAAMAAGALANSAADCAVAVTGVAGPGGGTVAKPVGMVCFGWIARGRPPRTATLHFPGNRAAVRDASVEASLSGLLQLVGEVAL
ncbi:MAG TPA: CinA family protein [Casimicrobiaceae bacterium]|nr:CinA family protein [Casimicrobiaceae bacterium]